LLVVSAARPCPKFTKLSVDSLVGPAYLGTRFDKIFAINVVLFWRQQPVRELTILRDHLAPKGPLFLFHEPPPGGTVPPMAGPVPAMLDSSGFTATEILTQDFGRTQIGV
jgi:hypothetical protein